VVFVVKVNDKTLTGYKLALNKSNIKNKLNIFESEFRKFIKVSSILKHHLLTIKIFFRLFVLMVS